MRTLARHRRSLTWITGLTVAATIAVASATTVLAVGPACTVDGRAISQEEAAADPSLCPAAPAPAPEPAPEPTPAPEPAPAAPAPAPDATVPVAEPAPTAPAPAPETPAAETPAATAPAPAGDQPAAAEPSADPATPAPATEAPAATTEPARQVETAPRGAAPATTAPATTAPATTKPGAAKPSAAKPGAAKPAAAKPAAAAPAGGGDGPAAPTDAAPAPNAGQQAAQAKLFGTPFRDARLFREKFTPKGRIPEQPRLAAERADLMVAAAKGTGTHWTTLAAVAWVESRWDDPTAGGIVGRRLSDADWSRYGTDGDDDGQVSRASQPDQARTVATFLAKVDPDNEKALQAYFNRTNRVYVARRTQLMADWFRALGRDALVDGLDDADARDALAEATLADDRITIYDGGRADIKAGLIDPRVLVTVRFLANRFDTVSISSMVSGHGVYTAGGGISLHSYGQAVDIASLGGETITGATQGRGGKTWTAVRDLLLLPESMQPKELISLWDMGGASFALSDHADHIHVGFTNEHDAEDGHAH